MAKFYIKWRVNPQFTPVDPKERVKLWLGMLEMVKADVKAGFVKDWGLVAGGGVGYAVREEKSEADVFTALLKWMPYVDFEVEPVLTVDQTIDSIKKAVAAAPK